MGNCFKSSKSKTHYSIHDDPPTLKSELIQLPSDEFVSALVSKGKTWLIGQEMTISEFYEYELLKVWDTQERAKEIFILDELIFSGGKVIEGFDNSSKRVLEFSGHERPVTAFEGWNENLISGSGDWTLRIWDLNRESEVSKHLINWNVVTSMKRFSEEDLIVQTSEDLRIRIWDLKSKNFQLVESTSAGTNFPNCCDVCEDYVVTGHRGFDEESSEIRIYDRRKFSEPFIVRSHDESVESVSFVGSNLYSCGKDGKILGLNLEGEILEEWIHPQTVPFVKMVPVSSGLIVANSVPKVNYFSVRPLKLMA